MIKFGRRTVFAMMCAVLLSVQVFAEKMLVAGGQIIGIELSDGSVTVAAFDDTLGDTARNAGLQVGDRIVAVDDRHVSGTGDVRQALERSDGSVVLAVERDGKTRQISVCPKVTPQGPRLGVYLRQGITGVGTLTWYDPQTGQFGALGHGVNSPKSQLLPMQQGSIYRALVAGVQKGEAGTPGQLLGELDGQIPIGTLSKNTDRGIFGIAPSGWTGPMLPVGAADEIRTGGATILSTISGTQVREYSVEILKIYPAAGSTGRNLLLRITDPALLEATGGIVQGMSGSPIIQDGKLVGAVTHVLVNDPTTGYGIFIENMLNAAA